MTGNRNEDMQNTANEVCKRKLWLAYLVAVWIYIDIYLQLGIFSFV